MERGSFSRAYVRRAGAREREVDAERIDRIMQRASARDLLAGVIREKRKIPVMT